MTPTLTAYREKAEPFRIERLKRVVAKLSACPGRHPLLPRAEVLALHDYRDVLHVNWATVNIEAAVEDIWQQEHGQPGVRHYWQGRGSKKFEFRYEYNPFIEAPIPEDPELERLWRFNRLLTNLKRMKKQAQQLHRDLAVIVKFIGPVQKAEIIESMKSTSAVIREIVAALKRGTEVK